MNYIRRSDPGVAGFAGASTRELSPPFKGSVWYSKGLFYNGSHFINLLEFWLGPLQAAKILDEGRRWEEDPEPTCTCDSAAAGIMQAAWEEAYSLYSVELLSPGGRRADRAASISCGRAWWRTRNWPATRR